MTRLTNGLRGSAWASIPPVTRQRRVEMSGRFVCASIGRPGFKGFLQGDPRMSTAGRKVLFIVTSHESLGETAKRTGIWKEELAAPYYLLIDAGVHVDLASTRGETAPLDPGA
jgi:hypothetical protein